MEATYRVEVDSMINGRKDGGVFMRQGLTLDEIREYVKQVGESGAEVRIWNITKTMIAGQPHKTLIVA